MSDPTTAAPTKPAGERPAAKKATVKRRLESQDDCLTASLFALKAGSIESAKRALQELHARHADTLKFVVECGGVEDAIGRLDELAERLQAA